MFKISFTAAFLLAARAACAQTPAPVLAFDVASIKPSGALDAATVMSGHANVGMKVDGARVDIGHLSLNNLIQLAYNVKGYQISGPDWMSQERFDIMATIPQGVAKDHVPEMLQTLLADRFKLVMHRSSKDDPIYALVVGKNGPKLKDAVEDAPGATAPAAVDDGSMHVTGDPQKGMVVSNGLGSGAIKMTMANGGMHMESASMSMAQFAEALSRFMDHPVTDLTGLKGKYQVALDLSMEDMMNAAKSAGMTMGGRGGGMGARGGGMGGRGGAEGASDPGESSIFQNVQQLGLKLEARKLPVEMLVIDHLEKVPTEN